MAVAFGFSVGDFIAAINLVVTISDALKASGQASSDHKELLGQLSCLEGVLRKIDSLEHTNASTEEILALRQAASLCANTIESFWRKASKLRDLSGGTQRSDTLQLAWRRVRWAVCKKNDINNLRASLFLHTQNLELILLLVQKYTLRVRNNGCS